MRRTILVEGVVYPDGTSFDPGSLECPKDEVPVVFHFDFRNTRSLMGTARDFWRDTDGRISMELDIHEDRLVVMDNLSARVYVNQVTRSNNRKTGKYIMLHGELKGIGMVLKDKPWHPGYPDE